MSLSGVSEMSLSRRHQHRLFKRRAEEIENEFVVSVNECHSSTSQTKHLKITDQSNSNNSLNKLSDSENSFVCNNEFPVNDNNLDSDCASSFSCEYNIPCSSEKGLHEGSKNDLSTSVMKEQLIAWDLKYNIPNNATTDLLHILNPHFPALPLDSRTLFNTPRTCEIQSCCNGQFKYFGVKNVLISKLGTDFTPNYHPIMKQIAHNFSTQGLTLVTLSINVDGLPITSSSTKAFWPILGIVDKVIDKQPFVIGLYCGEKKPASINEFLRPFVDECLELEVNGIIVEGVKYAFRISCIVADAPARQFLKCIVSHCSSYACEKCIQEGVSYNRRMTRQVEKNKTLRTDESFLKI
ncbi:uncharacterized protein LOC111050431 isoform X1 [Nilaparvata lugens]|uniref:uncharacterized protein LOC111050431 isoform X1 n=1 Tax=Nilaparvata lugens TaxID=108931 RepID=UPI00193D42E8|nr:uncharacterized protein LOC111050431 isoform X1 [Nilaparvata lugens]